jgi:hypothetical protein
VNQNTILLGGKDFNANPMNDLWKWDGENWVQLTGHTPPGPRYDAGLVYDIKRNKLIAYGGTDGREYFQDTWEFAY